MGNQGYHFHDSRQICYHFENVFDRRSGPRRGFKPRPDPDPTIALTGPRH